MRGTECWSGASVLLGFGHRDAGVDGFFFPVGKGRRGSSAKYLANRSKPGSRPAEPLRVQIAVH